MAEQNDGRSVSGFPDEVIDQVLVNPEAPPAERVYDWNRLVEDTEEVLEVEIEEEGDQESEYYLLQWEAPADEPVETITAENATFAAEKFLLDDIKAQVPFPPWEDGEPVRPPEPGLNLAVATEGRDFLVGEAEWGDETEMTHGALWGTFSEAERQEFGKIWAWLRRDPDERKRRP